MAKYNVCARLTVQVEAEIEASSKAEAQIKIEEQFKGKVNLTRGTLPDPTRNRTTIKDTEWEYVSIVSDEPVVKKTYKISGPFKHPPWTVEGQREREEGSGAGV